MEPSTQVFLGRDPEMEELRQGLADAMAGRGCLYVIVGDPGIGKTRLADELALHAQQRGARVVWGRCWEGGGAPAYWPWVQILRACGEEHEPQLIADLRLQNAGLSAGSNLQSAISHLQSNDPEQARFGLFDTTTTFLKNAAARQPLVLILDDLHAADQPSLLLLRFLARELRGAPLLVVGTYREVEAARDPAISQLLGGLVREGQRLPLRGLSRADVAQYLAQVAGSLAADPLVDTVYAATEGHPLFLTEVVRLLVADRRSQRHGLEAAPPLRIPEELRTAIRQRLAPLSHPAREVLNVAAVMGREFSHSILEQVCVAHAAQLLEVLDDACAAGVVQPLPDELGRYAFAHVLTRETLYDDLPSAVRSALHGQIGGALERAYGPHLAAHLAEVAHHFVHAVPGGPAASGPAASGPAASGPAASGPAAGGTAAAARFDKAIDYTRRAGDGATAQLAYEDAARHYAQALQVLDLRYAHTPVDRRARAADHDVRCELLLALGDAQWGAGDITAMRATFLRAAEVARLLARQPGPHPAAALAARAALGFGGRQQRAHVVFDQEALQLLEEALAALGNADSALRARVLARLAYTLYSVPGSRRRREQLSQEAVAIARRLDDAQTLRWVLNDRRWALWAPDTIEERLAITSELIQLAQQRADPEMLLNEHAWRLVDLLELGDKVAADAELGAYTLLAHEQRRPWYRWYVQRFESMRALLEGRFTPAEHCAEEAMASAQRVQHPDAMLIYGTQILHLRDQQGRLGELEAGIKAFVAQYPAVPVWRYTLAYAYAEQGREPEARSELERLAARDFTDLPDDYLRLMAIAMLSSVCAFLGDTRRAALLYDMLLPYAERCIVVGFGIACLGSAARHLGLLAATMARWPAAAAHFERALQVNAMLGARPLLARTQYEYACMRLAEAASACSDAGVHEGDAGAVDRPGALPLLRAAQHTAHELGMQGLAAKIGTRMAQSVAAPVRSGTPLSPHNLSTALFRKQGDYWSIAFQGVGFQVKHLLGLAYIAHLLQHPGQEFHALDMVGIAGEGPPGTPGPTDSGDAGELLDARARAAYKFRLADLREELTDAESRNDLGRVTKTRAEMDALARELSRGIGLGGRARRAGSAAERARISVTKRIAIACKRIAEHDPALVRYFRRTIKTGAFCTYEPDPDRPITWECS